MWSHCLTRSCFIFPELLLSLCQFHWISQHSSWGAGTIVNCSRKKGLWNSNHFHEKEMSEHASWAFFRGGFWSKLIAIVDYISTGKIILLCKCTCCMCEYETCLARKKQECMIRIFCFTSIRSELPPEQLLLFDSVTFVLRVEKSQVQLMTFDSFHWRLLSNSMTCSVTP